MAAALRYVREHNGRTRHNTCLDCDVAVHGLRYGLGLGHNELRLLLVCVLNGTDARLGLVGELGGRTRKLHACQQTLKLY